MDDEVRVLTEQEVDDASDDFYHENENVSDTASASASSGDGSAVAEVTLSGFTLVLDGAQQLQSAAIDGQLSLSLSATVPEEGEIGAYAGTYAALEFQVGPGGVQGATLDVLVDANGSYDGAPDSIAGFEVSVQETGTGSSALVYFVDLPDDALFPFLEHEVLLDDLPPGNYRLEIDASGEVYETGDTVSPGSTASGDLTIDWEAELVLVQPGE